MTRSALLVGATGLVGGQLLARLLRNPLYDRVTVLARRPLSVSHPGLDARVVDFDALGPDDVPAVDDVYGALGSTIRKAGSQETFRRIDQHYTVEVARLARAAGARRLAVVSSQGANPASRAFYLRVKGDMEEQVAALGYPQVEIFRPSFILGPREERRAGEKVGMVAASLLAPAMLGPVRPYRPVHAGRLASAMITALTIRPEGEGTGVAISTYDDFVRLTVPGE
ncbi:NAD(P)H-binding protein [Streptomyces sp. NPDC048606]|uniref:NAD(P)H-binding protein n=1 Tax=Streptomyces sp. NPDC048606 TaxID=3154726 RepID=UPI00344AB1C4